jgi:hypothetical protein
MKLAPTLSLVTIMAPSCLLIISVVSLQLSTAEAAMNVRRLVTMHEPDKYEAKGNDSALHEGKHVVRTGVAIDTLVCIVRGLSSISTTVLYQMH